MKQPSLDSSRKVLKFEGIIILECGDAHGAIARDLGVPIPGPGEFVSVRVFPASNADVLKAKIGNKLWRVATPSDPVVRAPDLPKVKDQGERKDERKHQR